MARLSGNGFIREVENATSVLCDACAGGHVEEVIFISSPRGCPPRAYIYCPENGHVKVPLYRLRQWEIDFGGLARAIALTLDLAGDSEEVVPGRIWFLGRATIAARSRELFLARGLTWEDARDVIGKSTRLNAARSAIVFAAGDVPPEEIWNGDAPPVLAFKTVASFEQAGLSVDRPHMESVLSAGRKKTATVPVKSFPTPAGTTWADVRIIVTDREMSITAKGKRRDHTFIEAGFEERRKRAAPDRLWALLKAFAMHGGVLPFRAVEDRTRTNLKQYVSDLRQRLAALLPGIEGESIAHDKDGKSYRTVFRISCEEVLQFPTPRGASWTDVSITKRGDSSIRIAVTATEEFATSDYSDEDDGSTHQWVGAERKGMVHRDYDLRMLKLADDEDRPNRAGQALLSVLSGEGTIKSKANDKGMAELCGVLTKLMQITESPFRFAKFGEKWVALFDASH